MSRNSHGFTFIASIAILALGSAYAIEIPDPGLEAALRDTLEQPEGELTEAALASIYNLDASGYGICDLTGLEYCTSLGTIDLSNNLLTEVHHLPPAGVTEIYNLNLDNNCISSFADLSLPASLYELNMRANELSSFDNFAAPYYLRVLDLSHNHFTTLEGMPAPDLLDLNMSYNELTSLAGIPSFGSLETLSFAFNSLTEAQDLEDLSSMDSGNINLSHNLLTSVSSLHLPPGIHALYLNDNQITSLEGFPEAPSLEWLCLASNQLTNLDGIQHLTWLSMINVAGNQLSSLTGLEDFAYLTDICAASNALTSLSELAGLSYLSTLDASWNQLDSLAGLEFCLNLLSLDIQSNSITSLQPIAACTGLWELYANNNLLSDLSAIQNASGLRYLFVHDNPTGNIESLINGLPELAHLGVSEGQISGWDYLDSRKSLWYSLMLQGSNFGLPENISEFTALRILGIQDAAVSSLSELAGLTELRQLALPGNAVTDITPLAGLTKLNVLDLSGNPIANLAPLAGLDSVSFLDLSQSAVEELSTLLENSIPNASLAQLDTLWRMHPEWGDFNICAPSAPLVNLTGAPAASSPETAALRQKRIAVVTDGTVCRATYEQTGGSFHTADQNADLRISLSEILRVIQFFNSDGYHCQTGTEDGYAPGPGALSCAFHNSDYNLPDGNINLSELMRLIQFFNSPGYRPCNCAEDHFIPLAG